MRSRSQLNHWWGATTARSIELHSTRTEPSTSDRLVIAQNYSSPQRAMAGLDPSPGCPRVVEDRGVSRVQPRAAVPDLNWTIWQGSVCLYSHANKQTQYTGSNCSDRWQHVPYRHTKSCRIRPSTRIPRAPTWIQPINWRRHLVATDAVQTLVVFFPTNLSFNKQAASLFMVEPPSGQSMNKPTVEKP